MNITNYIESQYSELRSEFEGNEESTNLYLEIKHQ